MTQGRCKIPIAKIISKSKRHVAFAFSKRRAGLFKKASEFYVLTGARIAIVTFFEAGKAFTFGNLILQLADVSAATSSAAGVFSSCSATVSCIFMSPFNVWDWSGLICCSGWLVISIVEVSIPPPKNGTIVVVVVGSAARGLIVRVGAAERAFVRTHLKVLLLSPESSLGLPKSGTFGGILEDEGSVIYLVCTIIDCLMTSSASTIRDCVFSSLMVIGFVEGLSDSVSSSEWSAWPIVWYAFPQASVVGLQASFGYLILVKFSGENDLLYNITELLLFCTVCAAECWLLCTYATIETFFFCTPTVVAMFFF
ncbi:Agamous-like MADS-box protein AGL61-like protein [Drosera capensis]